MESFTRLYLLPGELVVAEQPTLITTVLGSCVALTFHHRRRRIGAICHALLPWGGPQADSGRFVDSALRRLLDEFACRGIEPREIEVKLFGGANLAGGMESLAVGRKNVAAAEKLAAAAGLRIRACSIGGGQGLRLRFLTATGEVWLQRMRASALPPAPAGNRMAEVPEKLAARGGGRYG